MDTTRQLLVAALALKRGLIDPAQFAEVADGEAGRPLGELLVQRGWISPALQLDLESEAHRQLATSDTPVGAAEVSPDDARKALEFLDSADDDTMDDPPPPGRYTRTRLHGEGGMGEVWQARDAQVGRQVALKRLKAKHEDNGTLRARFLAEARITGQLEHPGIVPVYEVIEREGEAPAYTMRLVRGRTLTEAVREYHGRQAGNAVVLRDLLQAFVAVCNTLAYAHSRGVVHRDLKGSNVVLGPFGEVVVLDWGMAKVLATGESEERPVRPLAEGDLEATEAGRVGGTPGYMAPEQARGQAELIDRRTDVFGLGAVLYEILTGRPPYKGADKSEVLRQAREGEVTPPREVARGVPRALEAACLKALAREPEKRYQRAEGLADEVKHWLADEPIAAYREPLPARMVRWARRHRPLVTGAAVALLLTGAAAIGGWVWVERDRAARLAEHARQKSETRAAVEAFLSEATSHEQRGEWPEAKSALEQAAVRLGGEDEALHWQILQRRARLTLLAQLDAVRERRTTINPETLDYDTASAPAGYQAAFLEYGLAVEEGGLESVAEQIRTSPLREPLLAALDDWAEHSTDAAQRARLLAVARRADPHPWKDRFRDPAARSDRMALMRLAAWAPIPELSPAIVVSLANQLNRHGASAVELLRRAQMQYPDDFFLNCILAIRLSNQAQGSLGEEAKIAGEEAIGFYRCALAVRPRSSMATTSLGAALAARGRCVEAEAAHRKALLLQPDNAVTYTGLASALTFLGKLDEAEEAAKQAIRLKGNFPAAHSVLGRALLHRGKFAEAEQACRAALALEPHRDLSLINLGAALREQGKLSEAEKVGRQAVRLRPSFFFAHHQLAVTLFTRGQYEAAEAAYREAIRLNPDAADSCMQLGVALQRLGRFGPAQQLFRSGLDLAAKDPNWRASSAWWSQAARRMLEVERQLPQLLSGTIQTENAEELLLAAHLAAHHRLPGCFAAAANLLSRALTEHPEVGESSSIVPAARLRYFAACCAAKAAQGQGDAGALSAEERNRWRCRAAEWLRQELDWWARRASSGGPAERAQAHSALAYLKGDGWLDGVRATPELANLPAAERKAFQQLWLDADALLRQTRAPASGP